MDDVVNMMLLSMGIDPVALGKAEAEGTKNAVQTVIDACEAYFPDNPRARIMAMGIIMGVLEAKAIAIRTVMGSPAELKDHIHEGAMEMAGDIVREASAKGVKL